MKIHRYYGQRAHEDFILLFSFGLRTVEHSISILERCNNKNCIDFMCACASEPNINIDAITYDSPLYMQTKSDCLLWTESKKYGILHRKYRSLRFIELHRHDLLFTIQRRFYRMTIFAMHHHSIRLHAMHRGEWKNWNSYNDVDDDDAGSHWPRIL